MDLNALFAQMDIAVDPFGLIIAAVFIWGGLAFVRGKGKTGIEAVADLIIKLEQCGLEPDDGTEDMFL